MKKSGYFYLLTNEYGNVLYAGVTNNLMRRVSEHKAKINKGFTEKYNCDKLVYFEHHPTIMSAISREKQVKNWKREWKNALIDKENPKWEDLSDSVGLTPESIEWVKELYKNDRGRFGDCGSSR